MRAIVLPRHGKSCNQAIFSTELREKHDYSHGSGSSWRWSEPTILNQRSILLPLLPLYWHSAWLPQQPQWKQVKQPAESPLVHSDPCMQHCNCDSLPHGTSTWKTSSKFSRQSRKLLKDPHLWLQVTVITCRTAVLLVKLEEEPHSTFPSNQLDLQNTC